MTTQPDILERARYLTTIFGRGRSRWHFDAWSMRALREQTEHGEIAEYTRGILDEEIPVEWVASCIAEPVEPSKEHGCNGGWWRMSDYDAPCSGCARCKPEAARIGWAISAWVWGLATAEERARLADGVRGMQALAAIGRGVAAALAPGAGVSAFLGAMVEEWSQVRKGRWYRVAGARGRAREHQGIEGEAAWVGASEYMGRSTYRVGLRPLGHTGTLIYVSVGSVAPIATPAPAVERARVVEAQKAERATFKPFDGSKGDVAYVIDGEHRGKHGRVIWVGVSRGEARVGVKVGPGREDVVWCAAVDVSADKPAAVDHDLATLAEIAVHALCRIVAIAFLPIGVAPAFAAHVAKPRRARKRRAA